MAGPIMPASTVIEFRQFVFVDDDAMYDLMVMRFDDGDIEVSVEMTLNGASKCSRADLTLSADQVDVVAAALLDLVSISHTEGRYVGFSGGGVSYGINIRNVDGVMDIRLQSSIEGVGSVRVPMDARYAKLVGAALQGMAHNVREGL